MTKWAVLWEHYRQDLIDEYFTLCQKAEDIRLEQTKSVVLIQKMWRGKLVRLSLQALEGYLGRLQARKERQERENINRVKYYNDNATLIQKIWRGHFSRRTNFDYYNRKEYINNIKIKMEKTRKYLQERQVSLEIERNLLDKMHKMKLANKYACTRHHLLGTKSVPGNSTALKECLTKIGKNPKKVVVKPKPNLYEEEEAEKCSQGPFLPKYKLNHILSKPLKPTLRVETGFYDTKEYEREQVRKKIAFDITRYKKEQYKPISYKCLENVLHKEPYVAMDNRMIAPLALAAAIVATNANPSVEKIAEVKSYDKVVKFQVVGDWGSTKDMAVDYIHQKLVGKAMSAFADADETDFIVSLGDNFYGSKNNSDHGVASVTDDKWTYDWLNVYNGDRINSIPWYAVLGNHDWYQNQAAQIAFSKANNRWFLDDYVYTRKITVAGKKVEFLYITTDLIYNGYNGKAGSGLAPAAKGTDTDNNMRNNFIALGWTPENDTINKQLARIEEELQKGQDADYYFVVGHEDMVTCAGTPTSMVPLYNLFQKYKITSYMYGHKHELAYKQDGPVFFLQSGAGGRAEACTEAGPVFNGSTATWITENLYGFANVKLTAESGSVDFYNENGTVLHSTSFYPRNFSQATTTLPSTTTTAAAGSPSSAPAGNPYATTAPSHPGYNGNTATTTPGYANGKPVLSSASTFGFGALFSVFVLLL
ncbi:Tartrate-resistant acid phosphatase type 5 [Boothiomyces sp. JEL0838]|nr:Tartrate-resistant acid phosphatase type 5 [Boothiomyces sp. JEL0838]